MPKGPMPPIHVSKSHWATQTDSSGLALTQMRMGKFQEQSASGHRQTDRRQLAWSIDPNQFGAFYHDCAGESPEPISLDIRGLLYHIAMLPDRTQLAFLLGDPVATLAHHPLDELATAPTRLLEGEAQWPSWDATEEQHTTCIPVRGVCSHWGRRRKARVTNNPSGKCFDLRAQVAARLCTCR